MKILNDILRFMFVLFLSLLTAYYFGKYFFATNYNVSFSSFIVPEFAYYFIDGILLSYSLFLTLIFSSSNNTYSKWWWIGIGLTPVAIVEFNINFTGLFSIVTLIILGLAIGLLFNFFKKRSITS